MQGGTITLEVESQFHRQGLASGDIKEAVEQALSAFVGQHVTIAVQAPSPARPQTGAGTNAASPSATQAAPGAPGPEWMDREPMVKSALEIFKARFMGLKRPPAQPR